MASRRIEDLHPALREKARLFIKEADRILEGWQAFITDGYRSNKEQDQLYALGRTKPGKRVTNARAGQSPHNYGLAIDIAFRRDGTKEAVWDINLYRKLILLSQKLGLQWGGFWPAFPDNPHYELLNWRNYIDNNYKEKRKENVSEDQHKVFYTKFIEAFRKNKDKIDWGDDKHKSENLILQDPAIIGRMIDSIARSNEQKNAHIKELTDRKKELEEANRSIQPTLTTTYNGKEILGVLIKP